MNVHPPPGIHCQRTGRYITASTDGHAYICPYCGRGETYRLLAPPEPAAIHGLIAVQMCRHEFGVADDCLETIVWLGDGPQHVFADETKTHNIYLARASDPQQHLLQVSHEAFHRVCTPIDHPYHWTQEMLAVHFSLRYLDRIGEHIYAQINRDQKIGDGPPCAPEQLAVLRHGSSTPGIYAAVYDLGNSLTAAVGWDSLKTLALARTADGRPSADAWLASLTPPARDNALAILPPVLARDSPTHP